MTGERPPHRGPEGEDPEILDQLELIWEALEEEDLDEALDLAEQLASQHPKNGNAALALAAAYYEGGSIHATLAEATRAGELECDDEALQRWYMAAARHYLWEFEESREILEDLLREIPDFGEAWYLLAQVCEMQGDEVGARRGYAQAFSGEPDRFARPHRIDDNALDQAIQAARSELPSRFREILDTLSLQPLDAPNWELAQGEGEADEPLPPDILGLFVGTNMLEQSVFNVSEQPGVIFLFRKNLERACPDRATLVQEIRTTLWHELAHYLGFEEDQMADLGLE